ncbi:lipopolysaccharide biosynthesis glycosyltransferase [Fructobacillus pseudoficulneus]|uniref:Lipopolysaccharide biosynthesis glycosyltransferase n=1 Tax=Fructobacillus pseudoficulneus TaxID=220714 RepID=A0A3F3H5W6_9LACO|nr:DUF4422 domain-containing protein [Fructobacillus pseudoficulneus]GAP02339.1 lipopolysaccharide biosynthesis glycosyltransferase [Fructobacillus pseudoficulneus]SEH36413.1 protein of unknown function [Fructobacillus pseudoficulneus]
MKIYIATHRKYEMPKDDLYQPLMVGATLRDKVPTGYQRDDQNDNISAKNPNFNELTGLYWMWKNSTEEVTGLVHYRRYLGKKGGHDFAGRLNEKQIHDLLVNYDVILPKQRNYFIENQRNHYLHAHAHKPYEIMEKLIREDYADFYPAFQRMEQSTKAHLFNMFIMKKDAFNDYAAFVFGVLDKVEQQVDLSTLHGQDSRVFGFLSERLMDTWLNTRNYSHVDVPVISLEKTNWFDKGTQFLKRKFLPNSKKKVHF